MELSKYPLSIETRAFQIQRPQVMKRQHW